MNAPQDYTAPIIGSILHPTDFSEGSKIAFNHALKAALMGKSQLTLLHVTPGKASEWKNFPGVRDTLEHWGALPKGSPRSAVAELGIDARKAVTHHPNPVKAVLHHLDEHAADLIVIATHQHEGRMHWLHQSVAEPVARHASQMTLFIPGDNPGFISGEDGSASLNNILIPIAATPKAQPAIMAAVRLAASLNCPTGTFTLLHVGDAGTMPAIHCPEIPGWEWNRVTQTGDVIEAILESASKTSADLIVMATDGRHGFLDALRGSHSERVLRHANTPLLTVPIDSQVGDYLAV